MSRHVPQMRAVAPQGVFEQAMTMACALPGKLGHIGYRKLKRRRSKRLPDYYDAFIADLRSGDLCIDLGANVGEMTTRFAQQGADVIAFEPDPDTFSWLEKNTSQLPTVTRVQKATADKADRLMLRRSSRYFEDPERYSVAASLVRDDHKVDDSNAVEVEVIDFPAYLASLDRDVRILKIDIEGSEWDLLEALSKTPAFSRIDSIFVETHERFDPAAIIPRAEKLHRLAERTARPYLDLYWGRTDRPKGSFSNKAPTG